MLTLDQPANADTAKQYLLSYSARARKLDRMTKSTLDATYRRLNDLTDPSGWDKYEITSAILSMEYPDFAAAGHVYAQSLEA